MLNSEKYAEMVDFANRTHPSAHPKAAKILREMIEQEVTERIGSHDVADIMAYLHKQRFITNLTYEVFEAGKEEILALVAKHTDKLYKRMSYLGLLTAQKRYLLRQSLSNQFSKMGIIETWVSMLVRVACGVSQHTEKKVINRFTLPYLEGLLRLDFLPSTPTLLNAGTIDAQLASCFGNVVGDSFQEILENISTNASLARDGGGTSSYWGNLRGTHSPIKGGLKGQSSGVVPFIHAEEAALIATAQNGTRKSASVFYLPEHHFDFRIFLEMKKSTGDHRFRCHDMNTAVWISDYFLMCAYEDLPYYLFDPHELKQKLDIELNQVYDEAKYNTLAELEALIVKCPENVAFAVAYRKCVAAYHAGELQLVKPDKAKDLFRLHLSTYFETGNYWMVFKDEHNRCNPNKHLGVIQLSNLCTEISLLIKLFQTFVCVLSSINLVNAVTADKQIDFTHLAACAGVLIEALDNACSIMKIPVQGAMDFLREQRAVGLGVMGFHDMLAALRVAIDSPEAQLIAERVMQTINDAAIQKSSELAEEYGCYPEWVGSEWQKRGIKMRNSQVTAIAPTSTIALLCNVSDSHQPRVKLMEVRNNSTAPTGVLWNPQFLALLDEFGVELTNELALHIADCEGQVDKVNFEGLSTLTAEQIEKIRALFKSPFDIDQLTMVDLVQKLQMHTTQAISFNLFFDGKDGRKTAMDFTEVVYNAKRKGIKSLYYCRTKGASKSKAITAQTTVTAQSCSIDNEACDACQ